MVMVEMEIGLRPATLLPITQVTMVDFWFCMLLLIIFMKVFIVTKIVIIVVMMEVVNSVIKIPATLTFTIMQKVLMVMGELNIGL